MKRIFLNISLVILSALSFCGSMSAQDTNDEWNAQLPYDPATRYGQLENGLRYYIRYNINPKGQAEFYLVQKVGSVLEDDNQRGLAHFLEHMCFKGTENFPGNSMVNWLQSLGVNYGEELNAYTSIDETVYKISAVPTARQTVQDSCLLILHDWACALTLDTAAIESERGVILEERRFRRDAYQRTLEELLPKIYPNDRYAYRLPIGTMDVIANFTPDALTSYYQKWYRPDLQGVVVVGDVDVDYIEKKIKELFSGIKMPADAAERIYYPIANTPGTIYAIGKDKEIPTATVDFSFKTDALRQPIETRNSPASYLYSYVSSVIKQMLNGRLEKISKQPEITFAQTGIDIDDFNISEHQNALTLTVAAKDTANIVTAFKDAYRELLRAAIGGFTDKEYERVRTAILSTLETYLSNMQNAGNDVYAVQYVNVFLNNEPAPDPTYVKELFEFLCKNITLDYVNEVYRYIVCQEDNRVLVAVVPDNDTYTVPTEAQFRDAIEDVHKEDIAPYSEAVRTDALIPHLPAPGRIIAERHIDYWDATEYTLSNGVKVLVKPTDFFKDEISMYTLAKGNSLAMVNEAFAPSAKMMSCLSSVSLYDYSGTDLKEYYLGKTASLTFEFKPYTRSVYGKTTPKDLAIFMEKIYAFFTGFNLNEEEFKANQSMLISMLSNQEKDPQYIFNINKNGVAYKSAFSQPITKSDVMEADRQTIIDLVKSKLNNAADFTFAFVGDINTDSIKPLLEQYIATLPADTSTACTTIVINHDFELSINKGTYSFSCAMETPVTYALVTLYGQMQYTPKNHLISSILELLLTERIFNKVRTEMGAAYAIKAETTLARFGNNNAFVGAFLPIKPEMRDEVIEATRGIFEAVATELTEDDIAPLIKYLQKQNSPNLRTNYMWADAITQTTINDVPTFLCVDEVLPTITAADVMAYMEDLLRQDNYSVVILDPEETAQAAE